MAKRKPRVGSTLWFPVGPSDRLKKGRVERLEPFTEGNDILVLRSADDCLYERLASECMRQKPSVASRPAALASDREA